MGTFKLLKDFLWPTLDPFSGEQIRINKERLVKYGTPDTIIAMLTQVKEDKEYAKALADTTNTACEDEEERIKTVENKSTTMFGAAGLIITLVVNFSDKLLKGFNASAHKLFWIAILGCFLFTIIYFFRSAFFSVKALERKNYYKFAPEDAIDPSLTNTVDFYKKVSAIKISNRIKNYDVINEKVDFMVMAQDYFVRGIVAFLITGILYIVTKMGIDSLIINWKDGVYIALFIVVIILLLTDLVFWIKIKRQNKEVT